MADTVHLATGYLYSDLPSCSFCSNSNIQEKYNLVLLLSYDWCRQKNNVLWYHNACSIIYFWHIAGIELAKWQHAEWKLHHALRLLCVCYSITYLLYSPTVRMQVTEISAMERKATHATTDIETMMTAMFLLLAVGCTATDVVCVPSSGSVIRPICEECSICS